MKKEITLILIIKLIALIFIWWFFFAPRHKVDVTPTVVENNFFEVSK